MSISDDIKAIAEHQPYNPLTFDTLREANATRLPLFKNSQGDIAHTKQDGSDWCPSRWFEALIGEVGEWAEVRRAYDQGEITFSVYQMKSAKELADIQTYLDILARRSLDSLDGDNLKTTPDHMLLSVMAALGNACNLRKKLMRGDLTLAVYRERVYYCLKDLHQAVGTFMPLMVSIPEASMTVTESHPTGVDLGAVTAAKFNEVSQRVGAPVTIDNGVVVVAEEVTT